MRVGEISASDDLFVGIVLHEDYDAQLLLVGVVSDFPVGLIGVWLAFEKLSGEGSALSVGKDLTCAEIEVLRS